jgi:hypothetical protein
MKLQYKFKINKSHIFIPLFILMVVFVFGVWFTTETAIGATMVERLKGKILLQVEQNGESWYVNPSSDTRFYLGRPTHAFDIMRYRGLGISDADLSRIPIAGSDDSIGDENLQQRLSGYILLQVEQNGEAWYVYPNDLKRYYLGRPADAFDIMRQLGLGITDNDLTQITIDGDSMDVIVEDPVLEEQEPDPEPDPNQPPPVIYLPFSDELMPNGMSPMGETIEHDGPEGHRGIDFGWADPLILPTIRASMDATITTIKAGTHHIGTWDVATQNGIYGVDYTELESVNPNLQVGDIVQVGDFIGYPQDTSNDPESEARMIHWQFGIADYQEVFEGFVDLHLCPLTYFASEERTTLEQLWEEVALPKFQENAPYLCNGYYEGRDDQSDYE